MHTARGTSTREHVERGPGVRDVAGPSRWNDASVLVSVHFTTANLPVNVCAGPSTLYT
jgi:hypothetical protein